jgi:hypothetical protein
MAEAAGRERWGRASALMALLANVNRDPKRGRAFSPEDFSPFAARRRSASRGMPLTKDNLFILRQAYVDQSSPKASAGNRKEP